MYLIMFMCRPASLHVCKWIMYMPGSCKGQKSECINSLEMEVHKVESHQVGF